MTDSRVTLNARSTCSMEKSPRIQFPPHDVNLSRSDAVEIGSATVTVATVGVSPTGPRRTITNQTIVRFQRKSLRRDATMRSPTNCIETAWLRAVQKIMWPNCRILVGRPLRALRVPCGSLRRMSPTTLDLTRLQFILIRSKLPVGRVFQPAHRIGDWEVAGTGTLESVPYKGPGELPPGALLNRLILAPGHNAGTGDRIFAIGSGQQRCGRGHGQFVHIRRVFVIGIEEIVKGNFLPGVGGEAPERTGHARLDASFHFVVRFVVADGIGEIVPF